MTELTDYDLNAAIARVCGVKIYRCTDCWIACGFGSKPLKPNVAWDPVESWELVHEYVIPALQRAYCLVELEYDDTGLYMEIKPDSGGWIAVGAVIDLDPPPREFCKVALEAFEKLKETK